MRSASASLTPIGCGRDQIAEAAWRPPIGLGCDQVEEAARAPSGAQISWIRRLQPRRRGPAVRGHHRFAAALAAAGRRVARAAAPQHPAGLPPLQPLADSVRPAVRALRRRPRLHAEAGHLHLREHRVPQRLPRQLGGRPRRRGGTRRAGSDRDRRFACDGLGRRTGGSAATGAGAQAWPEGAQRVGLILRHGPRSVDARPREHVAPARPRGSVLGQRPPGEPDVSSRRQSPADHERGAVPDDRPATTPRSARTIRANTSTGY